MSNLDDLKYNETNALEHLNHLENPNELLEKLIISITRI